jgi:hypothetical protein
MHLLYRVAISENYAFGSNITFGTLSPVDLTHPTVIQVTNRSQQYDKLASYSKAQNRTEVIHLIPSSFYNTIVSGLRTISKQSATPN